MSKPPMEKVRVVEVTARVTVVNARSDRQAIDMTLQFLSESLTRPRELKGISVTVTEDSTSFIDAAAGKSED